MRLTKGIEFLLVAFCLITIGLLTLALSRSREPVFEGKPLSHWLRQYQSNLIAGDETQTALQQQAVRAVRGIGTNAIPTLLGLLRTTDGSLKSRIVSLINRQRVVRIHITPASVLNAEGAIGFDILGADGAVAVTPLAQTLEGSTSISSRTCAASAIASIGPAAIQAVPSLLRASTNANAVLRNYAIRALGKVGPATPSTVARLISALPDPDRGARLAAISALADYGSNAKPAIAPLVTLLGDNDARIRAAAGLALEKISPGFSTNLDRL